MTFQIGITLSSTKEQALSTLSDFLKTHIRTVVHNRDSAVLSTFLDLLQEDPSVSPGDRKRRDRGDVGTIRTSAILVRRITGSGGVTRATCSQYKTQ